MAIAYYATGLLAIISGYGIVKFYQGRKPSTNRQLTTEVPSIVHEATNTPEIEELVLEKSDSTEIYRDNGGTKIPAITPAVKPM